MPSEQILIAGGKFKMGSEDHYPDEGPVRTAAVDSFWIDSTPVSNNDFARFMDDTGHVTLAETAPRAEDYPEALPDDLAPGSLVFNMTEGPVRLDDYRQWWSWIVGADWRHPTGPDSNLDGLGNHPVVHVGYDDANAYARWTGMELPTEAEWEFAARGGLDGAEFVWGQSDAQDTPEPKANTWQGRFPYENTPVDGWKRTSPVGSYEPNAYGLYDMAGNVWEWTSDWYQDRSRLPQQVSCCAPEGRRTSTREESYDPTQPAAKIPRKVIKGGSHLCTLQYCFRYRPAARQPQTLDTSTSHIGFRCIKRISHQV